ncbi:acyltransferase family protein [Pseudorhodoferax sp.]|uniref:acyltransferase family protein n=1 Tax=Pseudorhodoferax sp. TaxID=1993553 RepID=UPI002DD61E1B|nr:acyltransferase [Pseudorhodoferax sp.]
MRPAPNDKLEWLQALRGVAALMVLFFHLNMYWSHVPGLAALQPVLHWGFAGVDIFFVLSGFVVHHATRELRDAFALRKYAIRRAARIYLTYWPALAVAMAIAHFVHGAAAPEWSVVWRSWLLLEPNVFSNLLPVAWSLTYELYFYVLLGAVMLAPIRMQARLMLAMAAILIAWNGWWLVTQRAYTFSNGVPWGFLLTAYALEFLAGALLSHVLHTSRERAQAVFTPGNALDWMLAGICCAALGLSIGTTAPQFDHIPPMRAATFGLVGFGGLLVALALQHSNVRAPAWLVLVGDSSFSLYLLHAPLLGVLAILIPWASRIHEGLRLPVALLLPALAVLISFGWFKLLEAPSIRLIRRLH